MKASRELHRVWHDVSLTQWVYSIEISTSPCLMTNHMIALDPDYLVTMGVAVKRQSVQRGTIGCHIRSAMCRVIMSRAGEVRTGQHLQPELPNHFVVAL